MHLLNGIGNCYHLRMKRLNLDNRVLYKKLIVAYALTIAFQIGWHWLLTLQNEISTIIMNVYLWYKPHLGKGIASFFDTFIPSVILGVASCLYIPKNLNAKCKILFILISVFIVVSLSPVYALVLSNVDVWWRPHDFGAWVLFCFGKFLHSVAVIGGMVYAYPIAFHEESECCLRPKRNL